MKNMYLIIVLVLTMSFLLIPLLATERQNGEEATKNDGTSLLNVNSKKDNADFESLDEIKLLLTDKEKIITIKKEEYVLGVVAAEMSAENSEEALKAQALAAYTFAYRKHLQNSKTNNNYDLTNDSTLDQKYIDEEGRKNKWGNDFSKNENKLKKVVESVSDELIIYNNEPILAVYHAISSGKTETAKNVWGTDYPYLQSENSVGDLLCAEYYSEQKVKSEEFIQKIAEIGIEVNCEADKIIGSSKKSQSGTVLEIELCGKKITGLQIREVFDLRSAAFDVIFENNTFVFTVSGYGHGVGMSQFGANYMAQQGSNYKEIISTYYRNCEIVDIN